MIHGNGFTRITKSLNIAYQKYVAVTITIC